ncbi:uncharacterized protein LOC119965407 [Scyliorhinus canicula]|uniref:uncharacterized protein LOC119965407 n=1 Tax=Scyliorhinus canicula TaxID=7830 RepID=UPI0018F46306|nr:uncharacterized protein LOC119965407 [Scyliorhinus canicula]
MSLQLFCSKLPAGLMFSFFVFLLPPISTQRNPNHYYFADKRGDISLKGPDNPGDGSFLWEWKPHSGQEIQQLVTFQKKYWGSWNAEWSEYFRKNKLYQWIYRDRHTINLIIQNPTLKLSGLFTLFQTQPSKKLLKQHEIFGVQVESSPLWPPLGSDVTLSCTISRLSDTVSLHWKQRDSSQLNRSKTDQIRINNTVYLTVKHVPGEDARLYVCEVKENGFITLTVKVDFSISQYLHNIKYTLYRSSTNHSEVNLNCGVFSEYIKTKWTWSSYNFQNKEKEIASNYKSQPINVNRTDFGDRLGLTETTFNGTNFNVRIVPVLFEDAGVYTCSMATHKIVTITLITVKVTAEPSDAVSEGDNVTLTCSVSDVTGSLRLVWISSDGKTVAEKTLNEQNGEEKSLKLIIQKAERGNRNWTCVLFHQHTPKIYIPHYLKVNMRARARTFPDIWIITVSGYLFVKLGFAVGLIFLLKRMDKMSKSGKSHKMTGNEEAVQLKTLNSDTDLRS